MGAWLLVRQDDGTYTLYAPNSLYLFNVSLDTLLALGRMFLTKGEENDVNESIDEVL